MDYKYIHIFGIPVDQLSFKLDIFRHIESQCDEKFPLADDGPFYYDFDDFFEKEVGQLDCARADFDGGYEIPYIIGIEEGCPWDREPNPHFTGGDDK